MGDNAEPELEGLRPGTGNTEIDNQINYDDGSLWPNTQGGSSFGTPSRPLSPVKDVMNMASQILEAGGSTGSELAGVPAQDLGAALSQLMNFDMSTQADIDSTKLQQMLKFMLGAVQTLATEQQETKLEGKRLAEEHAAMAVQVAGDQAGEMPDWAAKLRDEILAAAKKQAEAGSLNQIKDLQAMIDELNAARRTQEADLAKMAADMQGLSGAVAAASGDPAAMAAAMEASEAANRAAADAEKEAREKELSERNALKDEMSAVEEELRRIMALQTQMQQERAGVAAPAATGAIDADELAAAVERANAETAAAMKAMKAQAEKDAAELKLLMEKMANLENLVQTMAMGGGGDDGGAAAAMMSQFTNQLDAMRLALEDKAGVDALAQLQEELSDELRVAVNKVEAMSADDAEAAKKQRKLAMAAMEGAGGDGGGVPAEAMMQMQSELAALMQGKPDWAEIEAALEKKSDLDNLLKKADAAYVDELFKSLQSSMDNQLYDLQKAAKEGSAGASDELEKLEAGWRELQERLLDKADRDDLDALEARLMAAGAGGSGGGGSGGGKKGGKKREGTGKGKRSSRVGDSVGEMGLGEEEPEEEKELTEEERAAELARLQSLLEQRLANLQSINEHRGWGVRDAHVREFVSTPLPDGMGGDATDWVNQSAGTVGVADQSVDSSAHPFTRVGVSMESPPHGGLMESKQPENGKTLTQVDAVSALRVDAGFDLQGEQLGSNRRFTFDNYTWGKHEYKSKPKYDEPTAEPTDRDLQLLNPPHPSEFHRSFHGGSGQYMLDRSVRAGDPNMSQSMGDVLGMDGEMDPVGVTMSTMVGSDVAHEHAMGMNGAAVVPVADSVSNPAGVGLATSIRDPKISRSMGASLRRSRQSVGGANTPLATWVDAMPMPLPGAMGVRMGGGMVDRRKMQRMSGQLSNSMVSGSTQRAMAGSSLSAKNRVTKSLRPVGRVR